MGLSGRYKLGQQSVCPLVLVSICSRTQLSRVTVAHERRNRMRFTRDAIVQSMVYEVGKQVDRSVVPQIFQRNDFSNEIRPTRKTSFLSLLFPSLFSNFHVRSYANSSSETMNNDQKKRILTHTVNEIGLDRRNIRYNNANVI